MSAERRTAPEMRSAIAMTGETRKDLGSPLGNGDAVMDTNDIRLTVKAITEQYGVPARDVLAIIKHAELEPSREMGGDGAPIVTYSVHDFVQGQADYHEELRRKHADHDAAVIERIMPKIIRAVGEVVEKRMDMAIALRDQKENRLSQHMAQLGGLLTELRELVNFNTRMNAQVNLAAVAGMTATVPTDGVGAARKSLGVDIPAPRGLEPQEPGAWETMRAVAQAAPEATTSQLRADTGRQAEPRRAEGAGGWLEGQSPTFRKMFAMLPSLRQDQREVIERHSQVIETLLSADVAALTNDITSDDRLVIEKEVLGAWSQDLSDLPHFTTFYAALSSLEEWIETKRDVIPSGILFLAIENRRYGTISASDFLYTTGLAKNDPSEGKIA